MTGDMDPDSDGLHQALLGRRAGPTASPCFALRHKKAANGASENLERPLKVPLQGVQESCMRSSVGFRVPFGRFLWTSEG